MFFMTRLPMGIQTGIVMRFYESRTRPNSQGVCT